MNPIAILGFGRSGTTWISDIVSKAAGGLILFEPLHPAATPRAESLAYSTPSSDGDDWFLKEYFGQLLNKQKRVQWLLRNHLPAPLHEIDAGFVNCVWDECRVIGFKAIRANFMIDWFHNVLGARLVFVVRHPCAVIASLRNRPNFWNEFGWPRNYELFLQQTVHSDNYANHPIRQCMDSLGPITTDTQRCAVMWSITHAVALPALEKLGLRHYSFEDFYIHPFRAAKQLLADLDMDPTNLHPAHMFVPSMTTLKTFHGLRDTANWTMAEAAERFWRGILTDEEEASVMEIVQRFHITLYVTAKARAA